MLCTVIALLSRVCIIWETHKELSGYVHQSSLPQFSLFIKHCWQSDVSCRILLPINPCILALFAHYIYSPVKCQKSWVVKGLISIFFLFHSKAHWDMYVISGYTERFEWCLAWIIETVAFFQVNSFLMKPILLGERTRYAATLATKNCQISTHFQHLVHASCPENL